MKNLTEIFSPLAREKVNRVGETCTGERERTRELENLSALMAVYFKGLCGTDHLFKVLKEAEERGKQYLLRDALEKLETSFMRHNLPFKFIENQDGNISVQLIMREEKNG